MTTNRKKAQPTAAGADTDDAIINTAEKGHSILEQHAAKLGALFARLTQEGTEENWDYLRASRLHLSLCPEQSTLLRIASAGQAALVGWCRSDMPNLRPLPSVPGAAVATVIDEPTGYKGFVITLVPGPFVLQTGTALLRCTEYEDHVLISTVEYGLEHYLRLTATRSVGPSFGSAERKAWAARTTPLLKEEDLFAAVRATVAEHQDVHLPEPRSRGPR